MTILLFSIHYSILFLDLKTNQNQIFNFSKVEEQRRLKCKAAWNWRAQREVMVWPLINGYTLPGIESLGKEALNHVKRERVNRVEESSLGRRKWLFSNFRSNEGGLDSCVRILHSIQFGKCCCCCCCC